MKMHMNFQIAQIDKLSCCAGTVEIKFKLKDIKQTMRRVDEKYRSLQDQLGNPDLTAEQKADIETQIKVS